ncbi:ATP-binding protein [Pseudoalteromonas sp. Isolate3]|uniref:ATP-binding protein n=1 Tax=Pseudoalteromonas sp. Isolate3 TaxID=2908526 RepID=UPI001EFE0F8A|nr:ATP-binding protein [Pseudoalteromonas sp. Isolate3]MCG9708711.1 ATP-binding protein [Pseudoalteromonas sp. Isolate3]
MLIDRNWKLQSAFNAINEAYRPGGQLSGPQRNRLIETWGQLVGKSRATEELRLLIEYYGSMNKMSKAVQMAPRTIKLLKNFFDSLPNDLEHIDSVRKYNFSEGEHCSLEEDLTHEFKEIKGNNPTKSIQNLVDEYIVAYLNSSGGSIFWGICDNGIVKSLKLDSTQKDQIKKVINSKVNTIEPSIDPTQIEVNFHRVGNVESGYVVEVNVPKSNSIGLFFNSSGNTWVRINGCKQKLQGVALQEYIIQRLQKGN